MSTLLLAFYHNYELTWRLSRTAETYKDGWLLTGDEVYITPNKELWVVDRIKELIKVRGAQVAPSELEGHLLGHTDVQDACVVGIQEEYSGELPVAFVVLSAAAKARVERNPAEAQKVKGTIMQVRQVDSVQWGDGLTT